MEQLVAKLEALGLKKFINTHQHRLCDNTVNQEKVAAALQFDADQISKLMNPPGNFERCQKLYEYIEKMVKPSAFLQALEETNNGHVLKFIQAILMDMDFSSSGKYGYSLSKHSTMGIWFNLPEPIESFYGREDFLTLLHNKLKPRDDSEPEVTVLSQVKIVSGLGGIGKTETARKYIMKQRKVYNNFIWINAETDNSMTNSFIKLADKIQIPVKNTEGKSREIQEIVKEIYNKICDGGKSSSNLIVFDNAEDFQSCRQFFPFGLHPDLTKPVILATSRNQDWISLKGKIQVLPLDVLTDGESLEFILKELEIPESQIPEFKEESKEFIELIGGLPLALQQAVAYIKREKELRKFLGKPYKIQDYVLEFKSSMNKFLSFVPIPDSDSSATVFVTWNVTFKKIQGFENGVDAVKILEILSFLYADKIPLSFLHDLVPEIKDGEFSRALKLLEKYSLIKVNDAHFCLSLHRQLQFVILQYLLECNDVSNVAMNLVEKSQVALQKIKLSERSDVFLNAHQIVSNQFNLIPVTEKFLDFMYVFGKVLSRDSQYTESLHLFKQVHGERGKLLGENHRDTLVAQHEIALNLDQLGRYEESLNLHTETLKQQEIHLGIDDPYTIVTKYNTATVLRKQGKYGESLELFQQVLDQWNKIRGENDRLTLRTQSQIAGLQSELGDFPKALTFYEDVEKKMVEILGADHQDVLTTKYNKATVLYDMGNFKEASRILNEVLEKRKEILGENHLGTINTLGWIAATLEEEEKYEEALKLYKKVYEIRKKILGDDHPHTKKVKISLVKVETKLREKNEPL